MDAARTLPFSAPARRTGLDSLRAWATVAVVVLHAGVPYTVMPMPTLAWPVRHPEPSAAVDGVFWTIEGLIMPLFLLLSGYGAMSSLAKKPGEFLQTRWHRLGWPLLGAALVLLPLELYIWLTGWALDGQISWRKLSSLKLGSYHDHLWGLSHLWYLEYLLIYSGLLWVGQRWLSSRMKAVVQQCCTQPLLLFALGTAILFWAPEVVVGFQHGFLPFPAKFAYSGLFFAAGVAIRNKSVGWDKTVGWDESSSPTLFALRNGGTRRASSHPTLSPPFTLILCVGVLFRLLPLIHQQADAPLTGTDRLTLACGLAAFAVLSTRSLWDWAWSSTAPLSPVIARLAQASFWIYLVHHPLVAICHIALRPTGWPALMQCVLVTLVTLGASLLSYEWLVRDTRLGQFLDGVTRAPTRIPSDTPADIRRAA